MTALEEMAQLLVRPTSVTLGVWGKGVSDVLVATVRTQAAHASLGDFPILTRDRIELNSSLGLLPHGDPVSLGRIGSQQKDSKRSFQLCRYSPRGANGKESAASGGNLAGSG